jgi:hypothetical protein
MRDLTGPYRHRSPLDPPRLRTGPPWPESADPFQPGTAAMPTPTARPTATVSPATSAREQSGSGEALRPPRPLRTGRESCPSSRSSLHERPSRDAAALTTTFTIRTRSRRTVRQTFFPSGGNAGRAYAREPHQQAFLLPTYLLVSLSRLAEVLS